MISCSVYMAKRRTDEYLRELNLRRFAKLFYFGGGGKMSPAIL